MLVRLVSPKAHEMAERSRRHVPAADPSMLKHIANRSFTAITRLCNIPSEVRDRETSFMIYTVHALRFFRKSSRPDP